MSELLLEIFSEEIPARMQRNAAADLERILGQGLADAGYAGLALKSFATPRRLAVAVEGLSAAQPDTREERKGPRTNAPDAALQGFLKSTGLSKEQLTVQADPKGDFYLAVIERKGRPTADVIAEIIPNIMRSFPWPKSMRVGAKDYVWVRPIHAILCLLDGAVVPFEFGGVRSGATTMGHRFLSQGEIAVSSVAQYQRALSDAHVILSSADRAAKIDADARAAAAAHGLELIEDSGLLEEVAGLVEWPVALVGEFDRAFLAVPPEVLTTTMRANQKYFALRDPATKALSNRFVLVANMITHDGGAAVIAGNQRVLRARLSDAKFFWDLDLKETLASRVPKLGGIVFHAKLGTQLERVQRIANLAGEIAFLIGGDKDPDLVTKAVAAAGLCKADLVSNTVGEFPEVQGAAGRYLALHEKVDADIADALKDHYKPVGQSDTPPTNKVAIAVALADKIDTLTGFFAIDEKPTGSKDPFALRRAALGVIAIILENGLRVNLEALIGASFMLHLRSCASRDQIEGFDRSRSGLVSAIVGSTNVDAVRNADFNEEPERYMALTPLYEARYSEEVTRILRHVQSSMGNDESARAYEPIRNFERAIRNATLRFFLDRLKVALRDKGMRHDLIDAVLGEEGNDDLTLIVRRVEALQSFLASADGVNLLAGYKRAANILKAERKKEKNDAAFSDPADNRKMASPEERALYMGVAAARSTAASAIAKEDFAGAMAALAKLRPAVDAFFDKVTVNDENPELRENRLRLLNQLPAALAPVADFAKIEG
jgi:glycyl-tRNA synthetase beta chain